MHRCFHYLFLFLKCFWICFNSVPSPIWNMSHLWSYKMSGLLILSQTTIKFPSEFFGPFRLLSIPNINRSSLTARDLGGRRERREIAEDIPGGRRWRESVPCSRDPRNVRTLGTRGRGNSLSVQWSPDPGTCQYTLWTQAGEHFTGTRSPQNGSVKTGQWWHETSDQWFHNLGILSVI